MLSLSHSLSVLIYLSHSTRESGFRERKPLLILLSLLNFLKKKKNEEEEEEEEEEKPKFPYHLRVLMNPICFLS